MKAIEYVVRDGNGFAQTGSIQSGSLLIGTGQEVSLHLRPGEVGTYARTGQSLDITLVDGRVITLQNFFGLGDGGGDNKLYISADGQLVVVDFASDGNMTRFAGYTHSESWGKWSPDDEMIFVGRDEIIAAAETVMAEEGATMLGASLLGGAGLSTLGLGAAGMAGAAALTGLGGLGDGGGGNGGGGAGSGGAPAAPVPPTVEGNDTVVSLDPDSQQIDIGGTAPPGSDVVVVIGDEQIETVAGDDGTWEVTFEGETVPEDGTYEVVVVITDPGGNETTLTGPDVLVDTVAPAIDINSGTESTGDLFNVESYPGGVILTGTGEPGAALTVDVDGQSQSLVIGPDGTWSVTYDSTQLGGGEYIATVTLTAVDAVGNTTVATDTVRIDTVPNALDINADTVEGDGTVNAAELADGVTITGTSEPGATVEITVSGATQTALTDASGNWSVTFAPGILPGGEYDATVTAVTTDTAGNVTTTSEMIHIDTSGALVIDPSPIMGDNIINADEAAGGVSLNGTTQPGSSVEVSFGGMTLPAAVGPGGAWTVDFPAAAIPTGETTATFIATATDTAGNISTASRDVEVDTLQQVSIDTAAMAGDGVINEAEAAGGVLLTGYAQPGSSVQVTLGGVTRPALADADGAWQTTFLPGDIPGGEYQMTATATATDAAGNTATATGTVDVDSFVRDFALTNTPVGGDGILNAAEAQAGFVVTGTSEPGSTVMVNVAGTERPATVAADGSWSVSYGAGDIPGGEYAATVTATATDAAGNTAVLNSNVQIDTDPGYLTLSPAPIEGDDVINAAEAADGVILTGTATPGSLVTVTMAGVTHTALADANGNWQSFYAASEIPAGTYDAPISASISDAAGNSRTVTDSVHVDTEVLNHAVSSAFVTGDDVINGAERGAGVTLTGTTEPGSSVIVTLGGTSLPATVDAGGNWSVDFSAADLPTGEQTVTLTATATDAAGNVDTASREVEVDTLVTGLGFSGAVEGDDVINAIEALDGFTLTGTVEPGSTVMVAFGGASYAATVDANGNWVADIPGSAIARGNYDADVTVNVTDAAGNTDSISRTLTVDTDTPDAPLALNITYNSSGDTTAISTRQTGEDQSIEVLSSGGTLADANYTATQIDVLQTTLFSFDDAVPDGSDLVITSADDAGNQSATLVALDDASSAVVSVDHAIAGGLQLEAIDLSFDSDAQLTLTESQLLALSDTSNTLTIHGNSDDAVTLQGAVDTGQTQDIEGETYAVYAMGSSGATVIIDDDITVHTGVI